MAEIQDTDIPDWATGKPIAHYDEVLGEDRIREMFEEELVKQGKTHHSPEKREELYRLFRALVDRKAAN